VLPRPGGPSKRMCDIGSRSLRQALITMPRRCTTAFWPITSRSHFGRSAASRSGVSSGSCWTMAWRAMTGPQYRLLFRAEREPASGIRSLVILVNLVQHVLDALERLAGGEHGVEAAAGVDGAEADSA